MSSSTPCGNSTIKKFAQMSKETFQSHLAPNEWPTDVHEPIPSHSTHLGQFSLKKDSTMISSNNDTSKDDPMNKKKEKEDSSSIQPPLSKKQKSWPSVVSDDWCPPGTSNVYCGKGSIHTCSDKICRWNCLGVQGSFLSCLLDKPIYITSLVVGRKFSKVICQRAICCRAMSFETVLRKHFKQQTETGSPRSMSDGGKCTYIKEGSYRLNHPTTMGTAIYLDESGGKINLYPYMNLHLKKNRSHFPSDKKIVLDMSGSRDTGNDVRFLNQCWIWSPLSEYSSSSSSEKVTKDSNCADCIDGETGLLTTQHHILSTSTAPITPTNNVDAIELINNNDNNKHDSSKSCTYFFFLSFLTLLIKMNHEKLPSIQHLLSSQKGLFLHEERKLKLTFKNLIEMKSILSPEYEKVKELLLHKSVVFRHWRRRSKRQNLSVCSKCNDGK